MLDSKIEIPPSTPRAMHELHGEIKRTVLTAFLAVLRERALPSDGEREGPGGVGLKPLRDYIVGGTELLLTIGEIVHRSKEGQSFAGNIHFANEAIAALRERPEDFILRELIAAREKLLEAPFRHGDSGALADLVRLLTNRITTKLRNAG